MLGSLESAMAIQVEINEVFRNCQKAPVDITEPIIFGYFTNGYRFSSRYQTIHKANVMPKRVHIRYLFFAALDKPTSAMKRKGSRRLDAV
jgi:hypothetical protein